MNELDKSKEELIKELKKLQQKYDSLKEILKEDSTERLSAEQAGKQVEQALKESSEKFDGLFNKMSVGIVFCKAIYDKNGNMSDCIYEDMNRVYEEFTALKKETAIGEKISEMLPGTEPEWFKTFGEVAKKRNPITFEMYHKQSKKYYSVFAYNSKKDEFSAIFEDITERKQAEQEIEESKEKYRGLSEAAFECIFLSEKGICIQQNLSAEKKFGYSNEEAIGRKGADWIAPEYREIVMNNILAGYEQPYEALAIKKDGTTFPCMLQGKMMHYKGKAVRVTSLSDITERKHAEEELVIAKDKAEESDRLKSAFLANMSHEIRTPMNGILGFANLLKEPELSIHQQKEYVRIIERSGVRMLNIINDIIDISKIEAGLTKLNIKESNINQQIEYIYTFFKPEIEGKGMTISYRSTLPDKESIIKTDREKVFSILTNLVKNAIKYSKDGEIKIGYILKGDYIEFYVRDSGIGIHKDRQKAIFERFIQADIEDKMAQQGAGLGLSISKAYVEMLGGKIWVESEEGVGSTFYFTLPYQINSEEILKVSDFAPTEGKENNIRNLKILIAEDDEPSEMLISIIVKEFSTEVIKAKTGKEVVEMCRKNSDINLILMDIQMPDMNGYEATRQIRQFNKEVIIIAQTAYGLMGDREKSIEAGCNEYIAKPINKTELLALIQKYFKN